MVCRIWGVSPQAPPPGTPRVITYEATLFPWMVVTPLFAGDAEVSAVSTRPFDAGLRSP